MDRAPGLDADRVILDRNPFDGGDALVPTLRAGRRSSSIHLLRPATAAGLAVVPPPGPSVAWAASTAHDTQGLGCLAGLGVDGDVAARLRDILDSLAATYARAIRLAEHLSGHEVDIVHVVGGGSRNALLCRLTATSTQRPVAAGPPEATAIGNALVQGRATGTITGGLEELRQIVRHVSS
jgi:sugar (pentulose or hexulose) kinase